MSTRRTAWAYRVVWGATGTTPDAIYLTEYNFLGQPIGQVDVKVNNICVIGAGGARVRLPDSVANSPSTLVFMDKHLPSADLLDTMDDADAAVGISSVSGKLGESHDLKAALFSTFFIQPVWKNAGGAAIDPGVCELVIQFKS